MRIGIDVSNIRSGGGLTHLMEVLKYADLEDEGIEEIVLWGDSNNLPKLRAHPKIKKINEPMLNKNDFYRFLWRLFVLDKRIKESNCDILFAPGSLYTGRFRPYVTISQNILPFDFQENKLFFPQFDFFRLNILRLLQAYTFKHADGMIFLTNFSANFIKNKVGTLLGKEKIIPHGIAERFLQEPKKQMNIQSYSFANPYKLLYVSIINYYKHQWNVVEAVGQLRNEGYPITLEMIGPANPDCLKKLLKTIKRIDPNQEFILYKKNVPFEQIAAHYQEADAFVFASSCENMPNIMIEAMASGLVISSSFDGPMYEVLRDAGFYFDPRHSTSIYNSLKAMLDSAERRTEYAGLSFALSKQYSWSISATKTFSFIKATYLDYHKKCVEY